MIPDIPKTIAFWMFSERRRLVLVKATCAVGENGYGALVEWFSQQETEVLWGKPVTMPLCPLQISRGLTRLRTRTGEKLPTWIIVNMLMSVIVQQDATIYSFYYISADSSTYFGWYPHPSSGAHSNCNYNIWHWSNRICYVRWRGGVGTSFRLLHVSGR